MLLWFAGGDHAIRAIRAARATVLMRSVLQKVGRIEMPGVSVTLRMSHSSIPDSFTSSPSARRMPSC
jgi:hypothetical protein